MTLIRCIRRIATLLLAGACLGLAACADEATTPLAYHGLASARQLRPTGDAEKPYEYRRPGADLRRYTKLILDPVRIYTDSDAQFGHVAAEDRRIVAGYMQRKFAEALAGRFQFVGAPEPGAVRLHLTLTGMESSFLGMAVISHLPVTGLLVNTGLSIAGNQGTYFGSASYAVELSDAETGVLLYAYVTKQTPDALDITSGVFYLDAAKTGLRTGAQHLAADLSREGMPETAAEHTAEK